MKRLIRNVRSAFVVPALFLLLGLGLRLYPFLTKPFSEDEMYSYFFATSHYSFLQHILIPFDDRPPLFYMILKAITYVGTHEQLLRLPGLLLSVLGLYVLYKAFCTIHRTTALTILFLSAFSLFQIDLSWQLRDYAIQIFTTSVLVFAIIRLFQTLFTTRTISYRWYIVLGTASLVGCMLNHTYIPFVIAVGVSAGFVWYVFSRNHRIQGAALFIVSILPSLLASGYYLHIQRETIQYTVLWIPNASLLSYASLPQMFLGFSGDFSAIFNQNMSQLSININQSIYTMIVICIFLTVLLAQWKNDSAGSRVLKVFSVFGFVVAFFDVLGISIASKIISHELFIPRAFAPAQVVFLSSIGVLAGFALDAFPRKKYFNVVCVICALGYLFVVWNTYSQMYSIVKTETYPIDVGDEMRNTVIAQYTYGDQVIFVPFYLRDSYLQYLWRNEKDKNYDILAMAVFENTLSDDVVRRIFIKSSHPEILFVEDVRLFDPAQTIFLPNNLRQYLDYLKKAKALCAGEPAEQLRNIIFRVSTCPLSGPRE